MIIPRECVGFLNFYFLALSMYLFDHATTCRRARREKELLGLFRFKSLSPDPILISRSEQSN